MAHLSIYDYPTKPQSFFRITDQNSFIQLGRVPNPEKPARAWETEADVGFDVGYSCRSIALQHRLTFHSVKAHLEWSSDCEWKGLISVCSTDKKARREFGWRQRCGRQGLKAFKILTQQLHWRKLPFNDTKMITVLASEDYNEPVVFIKATELIEILGLRGAIKREAEYGARDEWLALEWIPRDMVTEITLTT